MLSPGMLPGEKQPGEQNQKVARTNGIERMWHSIIIVIKIISTQPRYSFLSGLAQNVHTATRVCASPRNST